MALRNWPRCRLLFLLLLLLLLLLLCCICSSLRYFAVGFFKKRDLTLPPPKVSGNLRPTQR